MIEQIMIALRQKRNEKLTQSDWTQLPDSPLSNEKKIEWANYRQQLRDFPQVVNVVPGQRVIWPQKPE